MKNRDVINFKNLFIFLRKFFNGIMNSGKKDRSEKLFFRICFKLKSHYNITIYAFFNEIMFNLIPVIGFKPRHLGRMRYNIPVPIKKNSQITLAVKWLKESIFERKESKFEDKVLNELLDIFHKAPNCLSLKKKKYHYKEAFANKAFTKYLRKFRSKRR